MRSQTALPGVVGHRFRLFDLCGLSCLFVLWLYFGLRLAVTSLLREKYESSGSDNQLEQQIKSMLDKRTTARVVTILQSSGWGKSRAAIELIKSTDSGVYILLQNITEGLQAPDIVLKMLHNVRLAYNAASGATLADANKLMNHALKKFLFPIVTAANKHSQNLYQSHLSEIGFVETFWKTVEQEYQGSTPHSTPEKKNPSDTAPLSTSTSSCEQQPITLQTEKPVSKKVIDSVVWQGPKPLILVFDEASALTFDGEVPFEVSYSPFRTLRRLLFSSKVIGVFLSTQSSARDFAPPFQNSDRGTFTVLPPLYNFNTWSVPNLSGDVSAEALFYCQGRPLWRTYYMEQPPDDSPLTRLEALFTFVQHKLLGGIRNNDPVITTAIILGVLCAAKSEPQMTEVLIKSHLATITKIADNRSLITARYVSEPMVAEVAANQLADPAIMSLVLLLFLFSV